MPQPTSPRRPWTRRPRATRAVGAAAVLLVAAAACEGADPLDPIGGGGPSPTVAMSAAAATYLKNALDFTQEVFLYRSRINWTQLRAAATDSAKGAQTTAQTYPGIRTAVRLLNDRHSAFWPPEVAPGRVDAPPTNPLYQASGTTRGKLAYFYVPPFTGKNPVGRADSMLTIVRQLDQAGPCGWILDVRNNLGGYWAAMIAGINPILGDGRFLGIEDADRNRVHFTTTGASVSIVQDAPYDSLEVLRASSSYRLRKPGSPVAILQGDLTSSAGEMIVLAFKGPGKPPSRSFGDWSGGYTTGPYGVYLPPDSAFLNITATVMFDRNQKIYGDSIAPEQAVAGPTQVNVPGSDDPVMAAATAWLLARPECANAADQPALARIPAATPTGRPGFARTAPSLDELQAGQRLPVSPIFGGSRRLAPAPH